MANCCTPSEQYQLATFLSRSMLSRSVAIHGRVDDANNDEGEGNYSTTWCWLLAVSQSTHFPIVTTPTLCRPAPFCTSCTPFYAVFRTLLSLLIGTVAIQRTKRSCHRGGKARPLIPSTTLQRRRRPTDDDNATDDNDDDEQNNERTPAQLCG